MDMDYLAREWDDLLPHIEDTLRMENLDFSFEHVKENCQCEGKYCRKCKTTLCYGAFYCQDDKPCPPCRDCRTKRMKLIRKHPELKWQPPDIASRFLAKVSIQENGCWHWVGTIEHTGYGILMVNGLRTGAHRVAFELYKGTIPEGLFIDHLCSNRRCVNPDHLEAVTSAENTRRAHLHQHRSNWLTHKPKMDARLRARFERIPKAMWADVCFDMCREIYGDTVSDQFCMKEVQRRLRLLR